jgi:hypothetical protein
MAGWLGVYSAFTSGVQAADNATVRLDADNEVQPDLLLRLEQGGKTRVSADDFVEGPIAGSSPACASTCPPC